jgi:diketogulonate reductase-like aldo/keto reductase
MTFSSSSERCQPTSTTEVDAMPELDIRSTVILNNGVEMPRLGLGVYQTRPGKETRAAVEWALEAGYRHLDTAALYANEADVGRAVRESGLAREGVFVTTKLWNSDHGYEAALRAFDESLTRLGLEFVDLYLIHWPVERHRSDTWRALEKLYAEGRCRAIGVSNYMIRHVDEVLAAGEVTPTVNQVEFSPFLYQRDLLEHCHARGIRMEAYSPLTKGERLGDARLSAIARRYGKSTAQLLIRWALQRDVVVIPKSADRARIRENADVFDFEISTGDMTALDALNEGLHTSWDPTDAP